MKRYIRAGNYSGDKRLDRYIDRIKKMVNLDLPSEYVTDAQWDMEDDKVLLNLKFINGDEHLFSFDTWRFTMMEGYLSEDADIILRSVENYIRNTGIDPFLTETDSSKWELLEKKTVEDNDGFNTDYTLWYSPVQKLYVCIFGDYDIYTPETTEPDAEFETKREAYEWFNSYGEDDWMDDVESCDSVMSGTAEDVEMTATDIVTWMYREFNDYEFYDERTLKDDKVRLIFEVGKKSSRDLVKEALDSKNLDYRFMGSRLFIDAPDDYETEYIGEACDVEASEEAEFVDMGTGLNYWYFTTHGVQPGSVPKGLNIIKILDKPEGTYFLTDRVLTTKSLKYYDIKERAPKGVSASKKIRASYNVGDDITFDSNYIGVNPRIHRGKIKTVKKSFGSKGSPSPSFVYVVEDENGKTYKVDEAAIVEGSCNGKKSVKASSHENLEDRLKRIVIQEKDWKTFIDTIEYETGLKLDSAYRRRRKGDNFIILYDYSSGETPDTYEAEITQYSDGSYELDGENIHYCF